MTITTTHITTVINKHLQKNVDFMIDNKTIKTGRILLFCIKDFYCSFLMSNTNKKKRFLYEIPFPFDFYETADGVVFDFLVSTFIKSNPLIKDDLLKFRNKKPSKLFNKKIKLRISV